MTKIFDYCIVGGGPSGLTSAYELLKKNKKILMIERDSRVGGLANKWHISHTLSVSVDEITRK